MNERMRRWRLALGVEAEVVPGAGHTDILEHPDVHHRIRAVLAHQVAVDPAP